MGGNVAMYNRTLTSCRPLRGKAVMVKSYLFTLLKANDNAEIPTYVREDQNFPAYATDFEKDFSILAGGKALPIVDAKATGANVPSVEFECLAFEYPVVGHMGWFSGYSVCGKEGTHPDLEKVTGDDSVIVRMNPPKGYTNLYASEVKFFLVTNIDGNVLWWTKDYDPGGMSNGGGYLKTAVVAGVRKALKVQPSTC